MIRYLSLLCLSALVAGALCACNKDSASGKGPAPAVRGVTEDGAMHPGDKDRCPVCAMTVHDRKFPAAIRLDDGRTFYFCGPGCMIRSWTDPVTHLGVKASHLESARATEYFSGKTVDAKAAIWVAGSDVTGPMGPMPVALENQAAVEKFQQRHGGKHIFRLEDLTAEKWQAIRKSAP
jgi:copper chaperone NosL